MIASWMGTGVKDSDTLVVDKFLYGLKKYVDVEDGKANGDGIVEDFVLEKDFSELADCKFSDDEVNEELIVNPFLFLKGDLRGESEGVIDCSISELRDCIDWF